MLGRIRRIGDERKFDVALAADEGGPLGGPLETNRVSLHTPIQFIPSEEFAGADGASLLILRPGMTIYADRATEGVVDVDGMGDFDMLSNLPLLSQQGECFLFRKMNFLKYQAENLRLQLLEQPGGEDEEEFGYLLEDISAVRNHIAECNLRLVISLARKFASGSVDFDELMSEGNEILLKAIARFDYSRGFRFSTYAVHSIQRHYFRYLQRGKKRDEKEFKTDVGLLNELPEDEADELILRWVREEQKVTALIGRMAEFLNEREQHIVSRRFGLGNTEPQTLRSLAEEMQLSKERVRQLQISAIEKLSAAFDEFGPPEE